MKYNHMEIADLSAFEVNPDNMQTLMVSTESSVSGDQALPVGIAIPDNSQYDAGTIAVRTQAWSASNSAPYQKARNAAYAHALGLPIVMPDTVGQGVGSPELTDLQREELRNGKASDIGRMTIQSAILAYEQYTQDKVKTVVLMGDSQGPSLHPGMIEHMPEDVDLSHVLWATPAGTRTASRNAAGLWLGMGRANLPGQNMNVYRKHNPEGFKGLADTNIVKSVTQQTGAHMKYYPALMRSGNLVGDTIQALKDRDLYPDIHIFGASKDSVSPIGANKKAVDKFTDANLKAQLHELKGHYHPVTEHIGFMAARFADALAVELPEPNVEDVQGFSFPGGRVTVRVIR